MRHARRSAQGFSLVELMISIVIGLIVVAGLVSVLMANRQAYSLQQDANFNQENLRFGASRLAWSLRMADFWGGIKSTSITTTSSLTGVGGDGTCDGAWVVSVGDETKENGIRGYDGAKTFPIDKCVDDANYVPYSDVVVVRYADTRGYDPAKGASTAAFDSTDAGVVPNRTSVFLVSAVGQQGSIFRKGEAVPSAPLASATGRYVYPYQIEIYYLRPCSAPGKSGKCGSDDDGDAASRSPALMRMRMDEGGKLISEVAVDGIEQLQFEYASPLGDSSGSPAFRAASAITNWLTVTQVRVTLVARSQARDVSMPHPDTFAVSGHCAYKIDGKGAVTYPELKPANNCSKSPAANYGDNPQQYVRTINTQTVLLRNRVRG